MLVDFIWIGDCYKLGLILEICLCIGFIIYVLLEVVVVLVIVGCVFLDELVRDLRICIILFIGGCFFGVNEIYL